jgi:RNA polymerase sigma-70 factor, ECF subfamily
MVVLKQRWPDPSPPDGRDLTSSARARATVQARGRSLPGLVASFILPGAGVRPVSRPMTPPETEASERSLLARMAAGDESALAALYDRCGTLVYSLAFAILGNAADAEEASADTFLQAWTRAASFDAERATPVGWLSMIARSRALDRVRARRRRAAAVEHAASLGEGLALPVAGEPAPDRAVERHDARRRVTRLLAELPLPQRTALELAYFGGLTHSEIAHRLGEPIGTIKTRIRAGLDKLRAALAADALA